ncbi:MAG: hypothetical protein AAF480_19030 [Actinomycetota bacterium]
MRGVYPGTSNPPTIGHLAICEAAIEHHGLTGLDLVVSRNPLAKAVVERPTLDERVDVIEASTAHLEIVRVVVTELRLIAEIAAGYDVVVMGADKWHQVNDPVFYESEDHRDSAIDSLPTIAVARRGQDPVPPDLRLEVPGHIDEVSSTGARTGRSDWMTAEAIAAGHWD